MSTILAKVILANQIVDHAFHSTCLFAVYGVAQ